MATTLSESLGHMSSERRKNNRGKPKPVGKFNGKNRENNEKKKTGDVVSDDDEEDGDSITNDDGNDGDDPDAFALSGTMATSRLAGLDFDNVFDGLDKDHHDDDDYTAVASFNDDDEESVTDEDEHGILRMAERDLIEEFEAEFEGDLHHSGRSTGASITNDEFHELEIFARRASMQSEDDHNHIDLSLDPFSGLTSTDDIYQQMVEDAEVAFDDDLTSWRRPEGARARENSVSQKKVRFESTPSRSSSMSSDDDPRDDYPDLFADLENPVVRQRSMSSAIIVDMHDAESTYDFDGEEEYFEDETESDERMSTVDSDDDGETTDEETVDEQLERRREMCKADGQSAENINASIPSTPAEANACRDSRRSSLASRFDTPKSNKKPKTGTFVCDPTSATVSAERGGSAVKLICPTNPPEKDREYWDRAREAMSASWTRKTPKTAIIPQLTAKLTLATNFDNNFDFLRDDDVDDIAHQLVASQADGARGPYLTSTTPTDDESNVNLEDYLETDNFDSDPDTPMFDSVMSQDSQTPFYDVSSPIQRRGSGGPGLLDHLEQQRGLVTSFRTNQSRARHISSLASNPSNRAKASECNALQTGRRSAANTPMTPARKKTTNLDLSRTGAGIKRADSSPMVTRRRRSRGNSLSGIHQTLALDRFASAT